MDETVVLGEECPSLRQILSILDGGRVEISSSVKHALLEARRSYLREASRKQIYGYCTGLGELYSRKTASCGGEYEHHVLVEHAMGLGERAPPRLVRAFLTVRLAQLTRGHAPVRPEVAERIAEALNKQILPVVPLHGSVGASGDLAPSAHAFLCLYYGEGEAYTGEGIVPCDKALEMNGLDKLSLEPGEALALINNTAWTTGIALAALTVFEKLLGEGIRIARLTLETARCTPDHYSPVLAKASSYRELGEILGRLQPSCSEPVRLQDPYSLRCTPQVYAAIARLLAFLRETIRREMCSSTENPVIVEGRAYHWCGFHSIQVSLALDYARIASGVLANIAERRIAQLLRREINGRSDFLAGEADSVGAMIAQYAAAALTASNRSLASPLTVNSIPTSGLQEDLVPMGPESGLLLIESLRRTALVLAIEEAVATYASRGLSRGVEELRRLLNEASNRILKSTGLSDLLPRD
ncbi:MAG: aromatic amino acid ammonia-lyase [Desulfurococcales archaeon]|nr:aromatic amino acid ammonia-lyase [Desulfurococcales archaeon]